MKASKQTANSEESTLHSLVGEAIQRLGFHNTQHISYEIVEDTVCLTGQTRSYYLKQMAQVLTSYVPGVRKTINRIQVVQSNARGLSDSLSAG